MAKYNLREYEVTKYAKEVKEGIPVEIHIAGDDMDWKLVKAIISEKEIEGGQPVNLMTEVRGSVRNKMFIKIFEELDVEAEEHLADEKEDIPCAEPLRKRSSRK